MDDGPIDADHGIVLGFDPVKVQIYAVAWHVAVGGYPLLPVDAERKCAHHRYSMLYKFIYNTSSTPPLMMAGRAVLWVGLTRMASSGM